MMRYISGFCVLGQRSCLTEQVVSNLNDFVLHPAWDSQIYFIHYSGPTDLGFNQFFTDS